MKTKTMVLFSVLVVMLFIVAGCKTETPVDPDPDLPQELKEDSEAVFAGQATTVGKVTYNSCTDSDGADPNTPGFISYSYTYLGKTKAYSSPDTKFSNGKFFERVCNGDLPAYDKTIYQNPPCTEFVSATVSTPVGVKTAYACKVDGGAPASTIFADINGDGKVNTQDLQCYALVAQNSSASCAKVSVAAADLDCDTLVTAADQKLAASIIMGQGPAAVDANGNGVLDCKEVSTAPTCTPGPTGNLKCVQQSSYPNQWYAVQETKAADCSVSVNKNPSYGQKDVTWCGASISPDSCVEGKGCCKTSLVSSVCQGSLVVNTTTSSCTGVEKQETLDCSGWGAGYTCLDQSYGKKCGTCPASDTMCAEKFEAGASKGWYAFTTKYITFNSKCVPEGWMPFTAGNTSCGSTSDSCVSGKGCVATGSGSGGSGSGGSGSSSSQFNCGNDKNTVTNSTVSDFSCQSQDWPSCRTDNTTFAGCMSVSGYQGKCLAVGTCNN